MTNTNVLPDTARVWVYQNTSPIDESVLIDIQKAIDVFVRSWNSHNHALQATGTILHNRFIVLAVDEEKEKASGCSIDTSVAFLRDLSRDFGLDLFNRMFFSFLNTEGAVQTVDHISFAKLYQDGSINDETKVFDTMVKNYGELQNLFVKNLGASWHKRMV